MSREKKRPARLADLPFPRHRAVRWLSPRQLLETSKYVALSAVFGAYADKREVQATAPTPPFHDHSEGQELWVDYVSDLGDGFDATYSVAYLLAQPKLDLPAPSGESVVTSRGGVLVMGGDEVYPSASAKAYEERTKGPYNAALPHADDPPTLFAVPGNHDWYDGLTAFLRFFCQGLWVGGWRTEQRRSYFAVRLPQGWWLLGIDIQFDTYIDAPQVAYFQTVSEQIHDGDGIILCTAKPSWVDAGGGVRPEAYATLDYFVSVVLGKDPQQVRLMLAGDAHHYARYTEIDGTRSLVTCGGGGAYLSATHGAPDPLTIPPETLHSDRVDPPPATRFDLRRTYPSRDESRRLAWRVFDRLPVRNPGFVGLMALGQALLAYVLVSGLRRPGESLADTWRRVEPSWSTVSVLRQPAALLAVVLVLWGALVFYRRGKARGVVGGALHGAAHLAVAVGTVWLVAAFPVGSWPDWLALWTLLASAAVIGGLAATVVTAAYLFVAGSRGIHLNELFSAQSIEDYKSFLRLHVGPDARLTMHAVAVPRACRSWRCRPADDPSEPWVEPTEPLAPVLIEPPVVIAKGP